MFSLSPKLVDKVRTTGHFTTVLLVCVVYCVFWRVKPSVLDVCIGFLCHFALTCFPMSVILHRYFSHHAYRASRPVTFALACISCLAYQYGPIWWSSKHRRHHRYCDQPGDPHSWSERGFLYAWVGWTLDPPEWKIDTEFVHPDFKSKTGAILPELLFIDTYCYAPICLMLSFLYFGLELHPSTIVWRYMIPTCLCPAATLYFNCLFHPPDAKKEGKKWATSKGACKAIDLLTDPLATLHGEAHHSDHHTHPTKAKRPGIDLGWYVVLRPLMFMGIVQEATSKSA